MRVSGCVAFCLALITIPASLFAATESLIYVQVKESKLRTEPQFWSQPVADLSYGTALVPVGNAPNDKAWIKAKLGSSEGYVHVSAITKRKVVLKSGASGGQKEASGSSVLLAGKGFNSEVENSYRTSKGLDFAAVEEVAQLKVEPLEEAAFIRDGKLLSN